MAKTIDLLDYSKMPDLAALMLRTVEALKILGNSGHITEIEDAIADLEELSEEEQAVTMPNDQRPRFNYFCAWARTYLRKAGVIDSGSRGIWTLVDGAPWPERQEDAQLLKLKVSKEHYEKQKTKQKEADQNDVITDESSSSEEKSWNEILLNAMKSMQPDAFERLAQRILRETGFKKVRVLGQSNDGGIDGVSVLRVNLISFQVYFQYKHWKGRDGSKEIRDFRGALQGRADKGLFITTGSFTSQAYDEATRDGAIAIDLIDGDGLCELLEQLQLGVTPTDRTITEVEVDVTWFESL